MIKPHGMILRKELKLENIKVLFIIKIVHTYIKRISLVLEKKDLPKFKVGDRLYCIADGDAYYWQIVKIEGERLWERKSRTGDVSEVSTGLWYDAIEFGRYKVVNGKFEERRIRLCSV